MNTQAQLIESRTIEGNYGHPYTVAIVATKRHGRMLIAEGWGSYGFAGETYRWIHGLAVSIGAEQGLGYWLGQHPDYEAPISRLQAVIHFGEDRDGSRLSGIGGLGLDRIARQAGL